MLVKGVSGGQLLSGFEWTIYFDIDNNFVDGGPKTLTVCVFKNHHFIFGNKNVMFFIVSLSVWNYPHDIAWVK